MNENKSNTNESNTPEDVMTPDPLIPDWNLVRLGMPVYAAGGDQLGTVTEMREQGLLVGGAHSENYFVTAADVNRIANDGVYLIVNQQQAMRATVENEQNLPRANENQG